MTKKTADILASLETDYSSGDTAQLKTRIAAFIRKSGLIPRSSAPVHITQRLQKFGIKPDGAINFLSNEPPRSYGNA
jgi:hypothetical protein